MIDDRFLSSFESLKRFCELEGFKGWDPYDGLNSKLFQHTPLKRIRLARLAWIQLFKRNPINLRPIFLVEKEYNPKGIGLFLTGYCNLYKNSKDSTHLEKIEFLAKLVGELKSNEYSGDCWGYNFDWQARAFYQPKYTPTVVATSFIACSLLDAYEITKKESLLDSARSSCDFILEDLNRTYDEEKNFSFSYSPMDHTQVFNATLLGSRLLSRVFSYTKEHSLIAEAKKSVEFCARHQQENGAWAYGTLPYHQWIDNFHTGYNLECIAEYQKYSGDHSYQQNLDIGIQYYLNNFFTEDGISKYYNNKIYPVDVHAPAQFVVTLFKLGLFDKNIGMINKILNWTIDNMQDSKGYFYYQKRKFLSSKIPYIRWAQAWMFCALSFYLLHEKGK